MLELCPTLRRLNKQNLPRAGPSAKAWDQVESAEARTKRAQRLQQDFSADGRNCEGCSCVYGNACSDEYSCLIWDRRHEVAAAVKSGHLDARKLMGAAAAGKLGLARELRAAGIDP